MAGAGRSAVGAGLGTALGAGSRELRGLEKLLQGECCGAARTELDLYWATGLGRVLGCPVWQKRARAVPRPRTQKYTEMISFQSILQYRYFQYSIYKYTELFLQSTLKCRRSYPGMGMVSPSSAPAG